MAWCGCCILNKRRSGRERSQSPLAEQELDIVSKDDASHAMTSSVHTPNIVVDEAGEAEIQGTNAIIHANPMSTLSPLSMSPLSGHKSQTVHHNGSQPSRPHLRHKVSDSSTSIVNEAFIGDDPPASSLHTHPVSESSSFSGSSPLLEARNILYNPSYSDSDDPPDWLFDPEFCHPLSQRSSMVSIGSGKERDHANMRWQSDPSIEEGQRLSHNSSQPAPFDVM